MVRPINQETLLMSPLIVHDVPDAEADYLSENAPTNALTKKAEITLSPSERRGRWLAEEESHAETAEHPAVQKSIAPNLFAYSLILAGVGILFAGMICGIASCAVAFAGFRR